MKRNESEKENVKAGNGKVKRKKRGKGKNESGREGVTDLGRQMGLTVAENTTGS